MKLGLMASAAMTAALLLLGISLASADTSAYDYAVPDSVHRITATARVASADLDLLKQIGADYANGYRIKEGTYIYTAPDRLEYRAHIGMLTVSYTTTNTQRIISGSLFHSTTDISKDITKRSTLIVIGLLPKNYLDTMRIQYTGAQKIGAINCQTFVMRYLTDSPTSLRHFEFWIDPDRHYIVQKRVWNHGIQDETIEFLDPVQYAPGFWLPTHAQVFTPTMQKAAEVEYVNVSVN